MITVKVQVTLSSEGRQVNACLLHKKSSPRDAHSDLVKKKGGGGKQQKNPNIL